MDLYLMAVNERRGEMQFTVLTNPNGFEINLFRGLGAILRTEVYRVQAQPNHLIINGAFTAQQLKQYIPAGTTVELVVGFENPKLPFRPPSY